MDAYDEPLPDFTGKAVTFYCAGLASDFAITLDSPTFELQAGRMFAVGNVVPSGSEDWTAGAQVAVGWDHVAEYIVFESASDFAQRIQANPGSFLGVFGRR